MQTIKVAIIGCGYVGKAIARHWQQDGKYQITATTTTQARMSELEQLAQQVVIAKGDDEATLLSAIQDRDIVILSIAPKFFAADSYESTYLQTAKNLIQVLPQTAVKQIIYTGSYSVYGNKNGAWVDEESPLTPANQNGQVLAETEEVLLCAASDKLKVCILRLGGIYGEGRELTKIFSRALGTTRPGNGQTYTNWIHLDDIVGAIAFAAERQLEGIYNLVGDEPPLSRDLLQNLCDRYNLPQVLWNPELSETRLYNARVSNRKLKTAGYSFIHPEVLI